MKNKIMYVICVAYFVAGYSVYTLKVPLDLIRQADPSITAHTDMFTLHQIGLIFMASTIFAALLTFRGKSEWAYTQMTFLLTWWALLYLVSWAQTGYWQSIYGFVNYALTAIIVMLCSRIIELPPGMLKSQNTPLPFEIDRFPEVESK